MTKNEFKEAMLRGLGRCVWAVKNEPEKYRDLVLWACKRNIAYDAQSEGTRSQYVHTMVSCYDDVEPFVKATAEALDKYRPGDGWDLLHYSEILLLFAQEGHASAREALEKKYRELLAALFARKRRPCYKVFHELDDLEQLGLVLAVNSRSFLRVAKDLGRLYGEKTYLYDGEFSWFFSSKGGQYKKALERAAERDEDIARFLRREQAEVDVREAQCQQTGQAPIEELKGRALGRRLARQGDAERIAAYAQAYLEQRDPEDRGEALGAFTCCPYPCDPAPIIADTRSACEALSNAAWRALEKIRRPAVRAFALENIRQGIRTEESFALLATNYTREDEALLEALVQEQIKAKDWDNVHAMTMDVIRSYKDFKGVPRPKHLLPLLYQYNPCSYCREAVLQLMSKHRMLTEAILKECLYDSNHEIRTMAAKKRNKSQA